MATLATGMQAQQTVAEQYLLAATNQERAAMGLPPLAWNQSLAEAARRHAERMATAGELTHQLPGEAGLAGRIAAAGAQFPAMAENIGTGVSPVGLHGMLMHSPHHRENILDRQANTVGIAVVPYRGQLWVVEDFASAVERLSLREQEQRVQRLVQATGLSHTAPDPDARAMCGTSSGFVGERPAFVMRFTASNLQRLPDELLARLSQRVFTRAAVGACDRGGSGGFYNIAVVLYR